MLENKFLSLLQRLHEKTVYGKVRWEPGPSQGIYYARFGELTVGIQAKRDPDFPDEPDIFIRLCNLQDTVIEEFSNETLRGVETEGVNAYAMMKDLYTRARRSAYDVERTIDSLLERLG